MRVWTIRLTSCFVYRSQGRIQRRITKLIHPVESRGRRRQERRARVVRSVRRGHAAVQRPRGAQGAARGRGRQRRRARTSQGELIFGYFWLFLVIFVWAIRLTSCFVYKVGTSKDLKVGQTCYALGAGDAGVSNLKGTNTTASFRQQATMSAGVVSGLRRSVPSKNATTIRGAIQTVRDVYIFIFIS